LGVFRAGLGLETAAVVGSLGGAGGAKVVRTFCHGCSPGGFGPVVGPVADIGTNRSPHRVSLDLAAAGLAPADLDLPELVDGAFPAGCATGRRYVDGERAFAADAVVRLVGAV
jgi:hypothetical protein